MSEEPRQNKGRGFFGDFRCGVLLFIVILFIYINIEIDKKNRCYTYELGIFHGNQTIKCLRNQRIVIFIFLLFLVTAADGHLGLPSRMNLKRLLLLINPIECPQVLFSVS